MLFLCLYLVCVGTTCDDSQFACVTVPRCVLKIFMCNERDDCGDLSDEDENICSQLILLIAMQITCIEFYFDLLIFP